MADRLTVFGGWLKHKRASLGLTLEELAEKSKISKSTLSRWELGDINDPQPRSIRKLAVAVDLEPSVIFEVIADAEAFLKRSRERRGAMK